MVNAYYTNMPKWGSQNIKGYGDSTNPYGEPQEPTERQGMDWDQTTQGVAGGLSAGAANSQPVGQFEVDQYAGFKSSGQGLMSGGVIGAIVGGVTAQVGQFSKLNKELDNLQTGVDSVKYDAYGRPVYQGSNVAQAQANLQALNKGVNKLNKTHLDPATNVMSSITGTRRKMKRKRAALQAGIKASQQQYNTADIIYRDQMNQRSEYLDRANPTNQLYNLYKFSN
jgi:hypothetical protein